MFPDLLFKHNGTDIVSAALVLVGSVRRADEEVLPFLKVVGGGIVKLLLAKMQTSVASRARRYPLVRTCWETSQTL